MVDLAGLMASAQKQQGALVALDVNVDTTTPAGEAMAHTPTQLRAVRAPVDR
jgi:hypothetical protein